MKPVRPSCFLILGACFVLQGCFDFFSSYSDPPLTVCEAALKQLRYDGSEEGPFISLNQYSGSNTLMTYADSAVIQRFLDRNGIRDSMRHLVQIGSHGISGSVDVGESILKLSVVLDSTKGNDTLTFTSGMESIALRHLFIHGGRFHVLAGAEHLPSQLLRLNLWGKWDRIPPEVFSLPRLLNFAVGKSLTDAGLDLSGLGRASCLVDLNLDSSRLSRIPDALRSWTGEELSWYQTGGGAPGRTARLRANNICKLSTVDSLWVQQHSGAGVLAFYPQICP